MQTQLVQSENVTLPLAQGATQVKKKWFSVQLSGKSYAFINLEKSKMETTYDQKE